MKRDKFTNPIPRVPPVTRADNPWRDHLSSEVMAMELCDAQGTKTEEDEDLGCGFMRLKERYK